MIQQDPVYLSVEFLTRRLEIAKHQRSKLILDSKESLADSTKLEKELIGINMLVNEIEYQIAHISNYKDAV